MKKIAKFLFGTAFLAAIAGGAYYVYKNYFEKKDADSVDDFDEAEDDFDKAGSADSREYVSINITSEDTPEDEAASNSEEESDIAASLSDPE